jgi:hypothetical protein
MVRSILQTHRRAVAMIELIFALVILGIVMMSAPLLISTGNASTTVTMQQEGINEAASRVHMIMSYPWDEQNTHEVFIPVLHTTDGDTQLAMEAGRARRAGTPASSQRTYIFNDANQSNLFATTPLGNEEGGVVANFDDMDDFIGDIALTQVDTATTDYLERNININTAITYSNDGASAPTINYNSNILTYTPAFDDIGGGRTSNIKSITVTLTSTSGIDDLNKTIVLRAFTSNIGSYTLEERFF